MTAAMTNDRKLAGEVSKADNVVDRLTEAIKLYVAKLTRGSLDEREGRRAMEIVSFAINLEHIGDIIDKSLCELAVKKSKRQLQFSPEGAAELTSFHKRVCESLRVALGVFMAGDVGGGPAPDQRQARELRSIELAAGDTALRTSCARDDRKASKPVPCILMSCGTSGAFIRIFAR